MDDLVQHILDRYHAPLRAEMPRRVRVAFAGAAPAIPPSLRAGVKQAGTDYWKLEWQGALGPMLDALHGLQVADIEIDPGDHTGNRGMQTQ